MITILHVNPDFAEFAKGRSLNAQWTWLDATGGYFTFPLVVPADVIEAATYIASVFNALPSAQRARAGRVVELLAAGPVLAFVGEVEIAPGPLAVIGQRVSNTVSNVYSYDFALDLPAQNPPSQGLTLTDLGVAMSFAATVARGL